MKKLKQRLPGSPLEPVCRQCRYRVSIGGSTLHKGATRDTSMCDYLNMTGEQRPGRPQGNACPGFKERYR